jgi:hypothetical protein
MRSRLHVEQRHPQRYTESNRREGVTAFAVRQHYVTNREITIDGDAATSVAYLPMGRRRDDGGLDPFFVGGRIGSVGSNRRQVAHRPSASRQVVARRRRGVRNGGRGRQYRPWPGLACSGAWDA